MPDVSLFDIIDAKIATQIAGETVRAEEEEAILAAKIAEVEAQSIINAIVFGGM